MIGHIFSLSYGDELIRYHVLQRSNDNGKVLIKVHDDLRVVAHAPESATLEDVRDALRKKAGWVWRQLERFRQQQADRRPRQYLSGESHFYLGRRYLLKVLVSDEKPGIKLWRGRFQVIVASYDWQLASEREAVKALMHRWYRQKAEVVFRQRIQALLPKVPWVESMPELHVQFMQKRWGSCSAECVLTLNTHLIKAPRDCIDYVILHELCHLREHNHSERFYRLLKTVMPDWQARKTYLDDYAFSFLE